MSHLGKKLRFAVLYFIYLILFVLAIMYFVFWRPFIKDLRKSEKQGLATLNHVNLEAIKRLGSVKARKKSSFINFAQSKGEDIIRLCAFGDSFTYGDEVGKTYDFPTLLQQNFYNQNINNVEVINFGNSWYGFHQAYIMWDCVGRNFDCDYILLGPACFQAKRDTSFNHTDLVQPYFFHSRYIIAGAKAQRVDVLGDTSQERFKNYFRFIPRWRYLRYDRNPPSIFQSILPKGRTLQNYFYYHPGTMQEEAHRTYAILLDNLADEDVQIVLASKSDDIVTIGSQVERENLAVTKLFTTKRFPYAAPKNHFSAWGNHLIAKQFYRLLLGQETSNVTFLKTRDFSDKIIVATNSKMPALSDYDRIEVLLENNPAGSFVVASRNSSDRGRGSPEGLKGTGIVSFLAMKSKDDSFLDACFIPLDNDVLSEHKVFLRIDNSQKSENFLLGKVRLIDEQLNIGVIDITGLEFVTINELHFHGNDHIPIETLTTKGNTITIILNDQPILQASADHKHINLSPIKTKLRRIRAGRSNFVNIDALGPSGTFYLSLHHPQHGLSKIPVSTWDKMLRDPPKAKRTVQNNLSITSNNKVVILHNPQ